jgi:hypothetical protein
VNNLGDKARRAFYAIKGNILFDIPFRIWLKILESVIEPNALYGCETWVCKRSNGHTAVGYKCECSKMQSISVKTPFSKVTANAIMNVMPLL